MKQSKCRWILGLWVIAVVAAGCSGGGSLPQSAASPSRQTPAVNSLQPTISARCKAFASTFDELVACQRANGTLDSFGDPKVGWRVRYFVRYWEMPCNEAPTEQEAYVFHIVTDDLNTDQDLDDAERVAIRNTMFDGEAHCK